MNIYGVRDNTNELHRIEATKFTASENGVVFHKDTGNLTEMEFVAYFFEPVSVVKEAA